MRQPILIVQGGLDTQVDPSNADRLADLARARKGAAPVEVVKIPGVNHLMVPATTGEVDEYADAEGQTDQCGGGVFDRGVAAEDVAGTGTVTIGQPAVGELVSWSIGSRSADSIHHLPSRPIPQSY